MSETFPNNRNYLYQSQLSTLSDQTYLVLSLFLHLLTLESIADLPIDVLLSSTTHSSRPHLYTCSCIVDPSSALLLSPQQVIHNVSHFQLLLLEILSQCSDFHHLPTIHSQLLPNMSLDFYCVSI